MYQRSRRAPLQQEKSVQQASQDHHRRKKSLLMDEVIADAVGPLVFQESEQPLRGRQAPDHRHQQRNRNRRDERAKKAADQRKARFRSEQTDRGVFYKHLIFGTNSRKTNVDSGRT